MNMAESSFDFFCFPELLVQLHQRVHFGQKFTNTVKHFLRFHLGTIPHKKPTKFFTLMPIKLSFWLATHFN